MDNGNKNDGFYIVKLIVCIAAIIVCILGLFKIISQEIAIPAALIMLAVIIGVFESIRDYKRGKKAWIFVDIILSVVLIAFVITNLIK